MGAGVCNGFLEVSKSAANDGVLWELGRVHLSRTLERRWLTYAWKLMWKQGKRVIKGVCMQDSIAKGEKRLE